MKRTTIAALGVVVGATAGCMDMGLEGNIPLEEARDRQPSELVAAVMRPTEAVAQRFVVEGRLWLPSGLPLTLRESQLRAIGSAEGQTVYARAWDQPPYDALFVRASAVVATDGQATAAAPPIARGLEGEDWIQLQPVRGRTGRVPAATSEDGGAAGHGDGGHHPPGR